MESLEASRVEKPPSEDQKGTEKSSTEEIEKNVRKPHSVERHIFSLLCRRYIELSDIIHFDARKTKRDLESIEAAGAIPELALG